MNSFDCDFLEQFQTYSIGHLASRTVKIRSARIEARDLLIEVTHGATPYRLVIIDYRNWGDFETVKLGGDPAELASYIISYLDEEIETGLLGKSVEQGHIKQISLRDGE